MEKEIDYLKDTAARLRRINARVKLYNLIEKAKKEYDSFDFDSGFETLKEAYTLDNSNPAVLRGLGCIMQFRRDYESAIDYYTRALEFSRSKEIEYTLIGMVFYLQDKLDEAVENFNLAIDENDDYARAYEGRNQAMLENHIKILDLQESLKKYF